MGGGGLVTAMCSVSDFFPGDDCFRLLLTTMSDHHKTQLQLSVSPWFLRSHTRQKWCRYESSRQQNFRRKNQATTTTR
jgi:hypothetical protein